MTKIREEKGLTYGIYSSLIHTKHHAYWTIQSEVQQEKAEECLAEITKELQLLASTPPSQKELDVVKSYLKGKFQTSMGSVFNIASMYKSLLVFDLSEKHIYDYLDVLEKIEPADISSALSAHLLSNEQLSLWVR
jgi:predicted Zn-dependent peptidase